MIFFRMRKAEKFLHESWRQFRRNASKLSPETKEQILSVMRGLQTSLLQKDRTMAKVHTAELRSLFRLHLKKRPLTAFWDYNVSLLVALVVVIIIRQSCFEPYEIPSGSMRPTFKEKDRLVVSKTQFGINIPLIPSHFIFDPSEVKRMGVFTFTGEGMDIPNVKTTYFYLFPGYKQYVKRMIGLPGDSIYFYGGKLYGIDKHGNDISHELQRKELSHLEHIPFIQLEGRAYPAQPKGELFSSVTIKQMNMPIAKLYVSPNKSVHYELLKKGDVHELFGMGNFAASRIIMKEDKPYLELTHHASAQKAKLGRDPFYRMRPILHTETSLCTN